jgi:undecaprenyl-diphosphatase
MQCFFVWIFIHLVVESLPLSSSGHITVLEKVFQHYLCIFSSFFDLTVVSHFLHGITAFILALFFFNRWFGALYYVVNFYYRKPIQSHIMMKKIIQLILFIIIADSITTVFYFLFKQYGAVQLSESYGFLITAYILIILSIVHNDNTSCYYDKKKYYGAAIVLGVLQSVALLPGISRLAITYAGARWLGFTHKHSFELSFAIQWPLIVVASSVALYRLVISHEIGQLLHIMPQLAMVIGGIGAWYALKLSNVLLKNNLSWVFGVYLIIISIVHRYSWW